MEVIATVTDRDAERALGHLATRADAAVRRGLLKIGFALGRRVAENIEDFKETPGTMRLSRSFLVPVVDGLGVVLGAAAPIYAAIHEFGGKIRARYADFLVFQTADGQWHSVKEVTISEKSYARDAMDDFEASREAPLIMGLELRAEWEAAT